MRRKALGVRGKVATVAAVKNTSEWLHAEMHQLVHFRVSREKTIHKASQIHPEAAVFQSDTEEVAWTVHI